MFEFIFRQKQTLSDQLSEEARLFSMQIISSTIARVDINASEVGVIVAASNDPHGVVEFAPLSDVSVEETSTTVSLSLSRIQGSSGTLQVNFSVVPTSADGNDFNIPSRCELNGIYFLSSQNRFNIIHFNFFLIFYSCAYS